MTDFRSLPAIAERPFRDTFKTIDQPKSKEKIAFYAGCLVDFAYPEIGESVVKVLNKAGIEVVFPEGQTCCGAPARYSGAYEVAAQNATDNIEAMLKEDVRYVVKKGGGWYDYEWDGKQKSSYVVKVDDTLWIGCGEYTESSSRTFYLFSIALIPIAWLMVSLGVLKMPAHSATMIGLAAAALLAFFVFKMPLVLVSTAALEGRALGLWPIMIVIIAAIFNYNIAQHTKSMDTIKTMLADITTDRRIQVLILARGIWRLP